MKLRQKLTIIVMLIVLLAITTIPVLAGGDKQRGDVGAGAVNQQWMTIPPDHPWH